MGVKGGRYKSKMNGHGKENWRGEMGKRKVSGHNEGGGVIMENMRYISKI